MTKTHTSITRLLSRLRREREGSVAIEAAFIVPIFFMMVFSIFEVGHVFYKEANIEQEIAEAAREVKVGSAFKEDFEKPDVDSTACPYGTVSGGVPCPCATGKECFYERVCQRLAPFLEGACQDQLSVQVTRHATFDDVPTNAFDAECPNDAGYTFATQPYQPGKPNEIVLLRACFLMKTFSPALDAVNLATEGDGRRAVVSVQLHRNEPYDPNQDGDGNGDGDGGDGS